MKEFLFLAEPSNPVNCQAAHGIASFLRQQAAGWRVRLIRPERSVEKVRKIVENFRPDALALHAVLSPEIMQLLMGTRVPLINAFVDHYPDLPLPLVATDFRLLGRMAAEHFLERQFNHFARVDYWSTNSRHSSNLHIAGFRSRLRESGFDFRHFEIPLIKDDAVFFELDSMPADLVAWVTALPRPCGVHTVDDTLGAGIVELCISNGIKVPEEIAVLGAGNAFTPCNLSEPQLSSIAESFEGIGRECARIALDWQKNGPPGRFICAVPPVGAVTRKSTEVQEVHSPIVARALEFIAANVERRFPVSEILKVTGVSNRTLVTHFAASLRRTPVMEIRRQRIEHAKHLLAETNETAKQIGSRCGISNPDYFSRTFKELTGVTPLEYRHRMQDRFGNK